MVNRNWRSTPSATMTIDGVDVKVTELVDNLLIVAQRHDLMVGFMLRVATNHVRVATRASALMWSMVSEHVATATLVADQRADPTVAAVAVAVLRLVIVDHNGL